MAEEKASPEKAEKKKKRKKRLIIAVIAIACWAAFGLIMQLVFGSGEKEAFTVEIFAETVHIGPLAFSSCSLWGLGISGVLIILALLFRIFCVPRFKEVPSGIQNLAEAMVEKLEDFITSRTGDLGSGLSAYIMALAAYLVGCAALELFGVRSPSSDILTTFSLALVTFFLINFYGFRKKHFVGRLKDYVKPTPVIAPIKFISDLALPVSMACRLFGNMLAGFIIMELLYFALGNFSAGPAAVLGLYFNVFHPLIQAFIFVTLTLSFIGEAVEVSE
jgi:F-type H+-transporting ATPase subunit a